MKIGVTLFIIAILAIMIWFIFEFKRMKHKLLAIFLIALLLFSFFSFNAVFSGKDLSIKDVSDLGNLAKIYFSWLGNVFNNVKTITAQAIHLDWGNKTT